nr:MAG TPA: hypothetical protein [Caudoviricetes sp.]
MWSLRFSTNVSAALFPKATPFLYQLPGLSLVPGLYISSKASFSSFFTACLPYLMDSAVRSS